MVELMRKLAKAKGLKWRNVELPSHGPDDYSYGSEDCMMTLSEFRQAVETNSFIDYDGFGHFATEHKVSNLPISPSELKKGTIEVPEWATHICWYNR
jgi:hypothetical protein